mgnify:CR=1 FL=1
MLRVSTLILTLSLAFVVSAPARAQDQTLADIRQDLSVLYVEVQRLKRELSTTGGVSSGGTGAGSSTLQRLDLIEAELTTLTSKTEQLENRIQNIVRDGTNRIGDLEFRLVELEGGDVSQLGETSTLGGDAGTTAGVITPAQNTGGSSGGGELAVSEQSDFDQAKKALDSGQYQQAKTQFETFTQTYTGGPLTGQAHYYRGQALFALGDTGNAARAFLESFSGSPNSPVAPDALYQLGRSLGQLGQQNEACITLSEVATRFPGSLAVGDAQLAMQELGCS